MHVEACLCPLCWLGGHWGCSQRNISQAIRMRKTPGRQTASARLAFPSSLNVALIDAMATMPRYRSLFYPFYGGVALVKKLLHALHSDIGDDRYRRMKNRKQPG